MIKISEHCIFLLLKILKIKKTSEYWQKYYDMIIYDPDGWNRTNYNYSWKQEKITYKEFELRAIRSTLVPRYEHIKNRRK